MNEFTPGFGFLTGSVVAIVSAVLALVSTTLRQAVLFLWTSQMGVGWIYLAVGAESLAIIQWIMATLIAISFIFYSILFGEHRAKVSWLKMALTGVISVGFILLLSKGFSEIGHTGSGFSSPVSVNEIGSLLLKEDVLSIKALAVTLVLVVIGAGVLGRSEAD